MPKIEILSASKHADLKLDNRLANYFDEIGPVAIATAQELPQLALDYPIFITKHPHTGQFELSALLGLNAKENLFVQDGAWRAAYIPLDLQRQPFQACVVSDSGASTIDDIKPGDELKLGVDIENSRLSTNVGEALFQPDGKPSAYVESVFGILNTLLQGFKTTKAFLERLSALELIVPATLDVQLKGQEKTSFDGLYSIDPDQLSKLAEAQVLDFHRKGYFQAIYALIHSQGHLPKLIEWKAARN